MKTLIKLLNLSEPKSTYLMHETGTLKKKICEAQAIMSGTMEINVYTHTHTLSLPKFPPNGPWLIFSILTKLANGRFWKAHQPPPLRLCLCHLPAVLEWVRMTLSSEHLFLIISYQVFSCHLLWKVAYKYVFMWIPQVLSPNNLQVPQG